MSLPPIVKRAKLLIARHAVAVAVALVVLGLVAFSGAAWIVTHPPTVEESHQVVTNTVGTDVRTSTVVTGETALWERGTVLENRTIYPLEGAPNLTVSLHTTLPAGETIYLRQELAIVYKAKKDGNVFWQADQPLYAEETSVADGDELATATFDVRQVRSHLDALNEEILGLGRAQAYLRVNISYQSSGFSGTLSKEAPLAVLSSGYWIGGELDMVNTHQTPVTRTVTKSPDMETAIGLGLLGFVSLAGAGGAVYLSSRRLDAEAIAAELHRDRYREWISAGRLGQTISGQDVAISTLSDLVNLAIDSNNRVIYDGSRELYAVVTSGVIFYFDPHQHPGGPDIDFDPAPEIEEQLTHDGGSQARFPLAEWSPEPQVGSGTNTDRAGTTVDTGEGTELPTDTVEVQRTISKFQGRLLAVYRLENQASVPVMVDVADRLPSECDAVGTLQPPLFEQTAPFRTFGVDGGVGFRELVEAEGVNRVTYHLSLNGAVSEAVTDQIRAARSPRVRRVIAMDALDDL